MLSTCSLSSTPAWRLCADGRGLERSNQHWEEIPSLESFTFVRLSIDNEIWKNFHFARVNFKNSP
jgi:hypothetical protein